MKKNRVMRMKKKRAIRQIFDGEPHINRPIDMRTQRRVPFASQRIEDEQGRRTLDQAKKPPYKTQRMTVMPRAGREPESPVTPDWLELEGNIPPLRMEEIDYVPLACRLKTKMRSTEKDTTMILRTYHLPERRESSTTRTLSLTLELPTTKRITLNLRSTCQDLEDCFTPTSHDSAMES
jgi:hypothetical protein